MRNNDKWLLAIAIVLVKYSNMYWLYQGAAATEGQCIAEQLYAEQEGLA